MPAENCFQTLELLTYMRATRERRERSSRRMTARTWKRSEKKSLAFHLVFQSPERTLTDNEINGIIDGIINAIKGKGWEIRK